MQDDAYFDLTYSIASFTRYLENMERSPLTIKNYVSDLRSFQRWYRTEYRLLDLTDVDIDSITSTDLRQYKKNLLQGGLRPSTINRKLATLRSFLAWAARAHLLTGHPPNMPRGVRETKPAPRWLDRRERNALLRAVERGGNVRDIAIITLLLNTGLRVKELCSLKWEDIAITPRQGKLIVKSGKGRKRRELPLNVDARKALLEVGYEEHQGQSTSIFIGQRGPLTPRGVQNMLDKYTHLAKLPEVSPHNLRHTFCKDLTNAGVSIEGIAALAGHESLQTTRLYIEPSFKDLERAVALIED